MFTNAAHVWTIVVVMPAGLELNMISSMLMQIGGIPFKPESPKW